VKPDERKWEEVRLVVDLSTHEQAGKIRPSRTCAQRIAESVAVAAFVRLALYGVVFLLALEG
jgi:hypothetical protein